MKSQADPPPFAIFLHQSSSLVEKYQCAQEDVPFLLACKLLSIKCAKVKVHLDTLTLI